MSQIQSKGIKPLLVAREWQGHITEEHEYGKYHSDHLWKMFATN